MCSFFTRNEIKEEKIKKKSNTYLEEPGYNKNRRWYFEAISNRFVLWSGRYERRHFKGWF